MLSPARQREIELEHIRSGKHLKAAKEVQDYINRIQSGGADIRSALERLHQESTEQHSENQG